MGSRAWRGSCPVPEDFVERINRQLLDLGHGAWHGAAREGQEASARSGRVSSMDADDLHRSQFIEVAATLEALRVSRPVPSDGIHVERHAR